MSLQLKSSILLLTLANLITTPASLLTGLLIVRQIDNQQYGHYAYMVNIFLLANLFFGFGLTSQIAKDLASGQHNISHISGILSLRILVGVIAAVIGGLVTLGSNDPAYWYAGAGTALFMYVDFVIGALSGLQRFLPIALLMLIQPLIFLGLVVFISADNLIPLYNFFLLSQLGSAGLANALFFRQPLLRGSFSFKAIKNLRWQDMVAGQVYVAVLFQIAYGAYGVTLLGLLNYFQDAGELSIALTVVRMLPLFSAVLVSNLYYPRLCALQRQGNNLKLKTTAANVIYLGSLLSAGCASLLVIYSQVVITLLYTEKHAFAIGLLQILAMLTFFSVTDQILTWTLIAQGLAWKALQPLLIRLVALLAVTPLAFFLNGSSLSVIIALAYLLTSSLGWVLQLHYSKISSLANTLYFTLGMFILGLGIGGFVKLITPWPQLVYPEIGGLALATLLYLGIGLVILHRLVLKRLVMITWRL